MFGALYSYTGQIHNKRLCFCWFICLFFDHAIAGQQINVILCKGIVQITENDKGYFYQKINDSYRICENVKFYAGGVTSNK